MSGAGRLGAYVYAHGYHRCCSITAAVPHHRSAFWPATTDCGGRAGSPMNSGLKIRQGNVRVSMVAL